MGTAVIAGILVLALLSIVALHIPVVQKEIILRVENRIEAATHYKIELASFMWWPLSALYLENVKIEAEGAPVLECEKVRVSYGLSTSSPYLAVQEVYLEKPFVHLERTSDGKWRIPGQAAQSLGSGIGGAAGGSGKEHSQLAFPLPRLRISSGHIEAHQQGKTIMTVKDITGVLQLITVQGPNGPEIRVDFDNWQARADIAGYGAWTIAGSGSLLKSEFFSDGIEILAVDGGSAKLRGRWSLDGSRDSRADLSFTGLSPGFIPDVPEPLRKLENISGAVGLTREGDRWTIEHELATSSGNLKGTFRVTGSSGVYEARLDSGFTNLGVPGQTWASGANLNGRLDLTALLTQGDIASARFTMTLDPSSILGESIQGCELSGDMEHNVFTIRNGRVQSSVADLKLSATADLGGFFDNGHGGGVRADIIIEKANLEKVNHKLKQRLGGTLTLDAGYGPGEFRNPLLWRAKVDANLDIPEVIALKGTAIYKNEQLKADYDLDCAEVQRLAAFYPKWEGKGRVASHGSLTGKWPDLLWEGEINSPRFQHASIQADNIALKGKGRLTGKDERRQVSFKAQNIMLDGKKISSLNLDLDQQKDGCTYQLKGDGIVNQVSTRLSGRIEKIFEFPLLSFSTQGQVNWMDQSGAIEGRFDVEKDGIRIQSASLRQGKQKLLVSGGLISNSRTDLRLTVESVNAGPILALLGHKDAFSGGVSGLIQVSGKPDQPECRLNLQASNCLIRGRQQISQLQVQGTCTKDTLSMQGELSAPGVQSPLGFTARIPVRVSFRPPQFELRQSDEMSCDVKIGGISTEPALALLPFLSRVGGLIQGEVHIGGSIGQPAVSGSGTWRDGFFQEKRWPHIIDNIQAQWQADSRLIHVRQAVMTHRGGTVNVTGSIEYPRFQTLEFRAMATDIQLPDIYGIQGKVSGQAEIRENPDSAELTGTLHFSKAEMSLGQLETEIAQSIEIIQGSGEGNLLEIKDAKSPSKFYNKLKMDIGLQLPDYGTWVSGKGVKAEITGRLNVSKVPAGSIKLTGELRTLRGTYSFQGKELKIVEGSLVFTGTPTPDPQLRFVCEKQVKDVTLQARVSGPLSRPKLRLSSIPSMNQVDILSYFMFDHAAGDMNSKESAQLQDRAAAWLGSETSVALRSILGDSPLAPDSFGYRSTTKGERGFTNKADPATTSKETGVVEIGKFITPDLYVTYGRGIKGEKGNEVQIEYRLNRHLSVQTQVGGADQSGIDVFWRHDFGK